MKSPLTFSVPQTLNAFDALLASARLSCWEKDNGRPGPRRNRKTGDSHRLQSMFFVSEPGQIFMRELGPAVTHVRHSNIAADFNHVFRQDR